MKNIYKRVLFILFILAVITGILIGLDTVTRTDLTDAIDSFEDCAAAGYPVMESYPEQCATPDGKSLTKQY